MEDLYSIDRPPTIYQELGLEVSGFSPDRTDAEMQRLVGIELDSARASVGAKPGDMRPPILLRIFETTASRLMNQQHYELAIWLLGLIERHHRIDGSLARMRLYALLQSGRLDALFKEMNRLDSAAVAPAVRDMIGRYRIAFPERLTVYDLVSTIGGVPETLAELVASLDAPPRPHFIEQRLAEFVHALRGEGGDAATFRERMAWGHQAIRWVEMIANAAQQFWQRSLKTGFVTADQIRTINLHKAIAERSRSDALDRLRALHAAGHSLLLTSAHAGIHHISHGVAHVSGLPFFSIRADAGSTDSPDHSRVLTTGNELQLEFAKLVRRVRREQHVISMMPDGLGGGDPLHFDLLGRKIALRQGAATIAYHGAMATFFCKTRWNGKDIELVLLEGPKAERDMDRGTWDELWYAFYLDCLRDIVLGEPEDMGGHGGLWASYLAEN